MSCERALDGICSHSVVCIVQAKTPDKSHLLPRERCEQLLDGEDVPRNLSCGVECRTDYLVRLDLLLLVKRETNCESTINQYLWA